MGVFIYSGDEEETPISPQEIYPMGSMSLSYDGDIEILNTGNNCANMLRDFFMFNHPVNIPDNIVNLANAFRNCYSFNQDIDLILNPGNITVNAATMFYNCASLQSNINIMCNGNLSIRHGFCINTEYLPDTEYTIDWNFNSTIIISANQLDCSYLFLNQFNFNRPVIFDNRYGLTSVSCSGMFSKCTNFNQPINIPNSAVSCYEMFGNCKSFNQPITIPNSVTSCYGMFVNCTNFNQPINIPNSVTNCARMFYGCNSRFNQPVTIESSVTNCVYMFYSCQNFNQPITVPESVTNITYMFGYCPRMKSVVRLPEKFNNGKTNAFWYGCPVSVENGTLEFY